MGESVAESSSWEAQHNGSAFLYDFEPPQYLRKDLSKQRNYLGIIKIFDFLGKIIGQ